MPGRTNNLILSGQLPEFRDKLGAGLYAKYLHTDTPLVLAPAFEEFMAEGAKRKQVMDIFWSSIGCPPREMRKFLPPTHHDQYPDVVEKWLPEVRGMKG